MSSVRHGSIRPSLVIGLLLKGGEKRSSRSLIGGVEDFGGWRRNSGRWRMTETRTYPTPGSLGAELFEMTEQEYVARFGDPEDQPIDLASTPIGASPSTLLIWSS